MNRDDIIKLAQEAGGQGVAKLDFIDVERFAALVAAEEREACAKLCESEGARTDATWMGCAAAIRSRGEK